MKSNVVADMLGRFAKSVGLISDAGSEALTEIHVSPRSPEQISRALAAARRIRARAREMKLGVTDADILKWVKEGKR